MIISRHLLLAASILAAPLAPAQQFTLPLWLHGTPEPPATSAPERDITTSTDPLIAGRPIIKLAHVSEPTLAVYQPAGARSGTAVLVFPGGGYNILAYDLEGTEACAWLNSIHVTCVLVKYRVPFSSGKDPGHYPERTEDLEDAQQAMRLTRSHAAEWGIDPKRIGVLGFSAGAHLAVVLCNHFDFAPSSNAVKDHGGLDPSIGTRPDFALIIYPAYLVHWHDAMGGAKDVSKTIAPEAVPSASTPPTFLIQTLEDPIHEECALVYFQALKDANIQAEIHIFAQGRHGYGLRPTSLPVTHWPILAEAWLRAIHVLN